MMNHKTLLSALLLSTALVVGGCGKKDGASGGDGQVADIADFSVKSVDTKAIEKLLNVKSRKVSSNEADQALSKMGLMDPSGELSWGDKSGDNGSYSYKNVSVKTEDGETLTIGSLDLTGVHMVDDTATFDRMDASNLSIDGKDGGAEIKRLSLSRPAPEVGNGIMKALGAVEGLKDLDDLDIDWDLEDDEIAFGALLMEGLSVKGDDVDLNLSSLGWGEDEASGKAVFLLEDLRVEGEDDASGSPMKISLDQISGSGIDMKHLRALGSDKLGQGFINGAPSLGFNPYAKSFDTFSMKNFNLSMDTLNIKTEGASGRSSRKGGVVTVDQSLSPVRIGFSGPPESRDLRDMQEGLQSLGFDELVFSASQTSIMDEKNDTLTVKNAVVKLEDGFNLNYGYEASGLSAVSAMSRDASSSEIDAMLDNMKLKSMNMALTDYNLVDRVIKFAADQQGTSPALIKMQTKGLLSVMSLGAQNEAQGKALGDIGKALGNFIDDGGTLKVRLNPETPVSVSQFSDMDPQNLDPAELGFSIEHTK